jgi:pantothenate kinase type III
MDTFLAGHRGVCVIWTPRGLCTNFKLFVHGELKRYQAETKCGIKYVLTGHLPAINLRLRFKHR